MTRYDRIKRLCKQNGFTVTGLEKKLGFARGSLCKINTSQPSAEKLFLIAETLKTTPDYIMTGVNQSDPDMLDMTYEVIANLCKERNIAVTALEKDLGFSRGSIGKLKNGGSMTFKRLQKVADYFNVSVDTFTNPENTKPQSIDLNDEINRLLYALTRNQSAYFSGNLVSDEGKLAMINSLRQDLEFLKATTKK